MGRLTFLDQVDCSQNEEGEYVEVFVLVPEGLFVGIYFQKMNTKLSFGTHGAVLIDLTYPQNVLTSQGKVCSIFERIL